MSETVNIQGQTACERFGHAWHQIRFQGLVCGRCDLSKLHYDHPELIAR